MFHQASFLRVVFFFAGAGLGMRHEALDAGAVGFEERSQFLGGRECNEVPRDKQLVVESGGRILDDNIFAVAAQDDANRRLVPLLHFVGLPPVDVEVHLPGITVFERPNLEINEDMAAQAAVIKDEVDVLVLTADRDAFLPSLETKPLAQFQQERLQVIEERGFKIRLDVLRPLSQAGEFQHIRIANEIVDGLLRLLPASTFDDRLLVGRETGAFIKQAADLTLELTDGPIALEAFILEEGPFPRIVDREEFLELRP